MACERIQFSKKTHGGNADLEVTSWLEHLTSHKISDRASKKLRSHTLKARDKDGSRFAASPG
jgi:hypothetical protein